MSAEQKRNQLMFGVVEGMPIQLNINVSERTVFAMSVGWHGLACWGENESVRDCLSSIVRIAEGDRPVPLFWRDNHRLSDEFIGWLNQQMDEIKAPACEDAEDLAVSVIKNACESSLTPTVRRTVVMPGTIEEIDVSLEVDVEEEDS